MICPNPECIQPVALVVAETPRTDESKTDCETQPTPHSENEVDDVSDVRENDDQATDTAAPLASVNADEEATTGWNLSRKRSVSVAGLVVVGSILLVVVYELGRFSGNSSAQVPRQLETRTAPVEQMQVSAASIAQSADQVSGNVSTIASPVPQITPERQPATEQQNKPQLALAEGTIDHAQPEAAAESTDAAVSKEKLSRDAAKVQIPDKELNADRLATPELVRRVEKAVVSILIEGDSGYYINGSGFVCRDDRTIVTNFHVLEDAVRARIRLLDGTEIPILGFEVASPEFDLVVLRADDPVPNCEPLPLLEVKPDRGTEVFAFGSPRGLAGSVSSGLVSHVRPNREIMELLGPTEITSRFAPDSVWVQTTAPISGGNSGGPLVDTKGAVVGVNTWSRVDGQNLNFALFGQHVSNSLTSDVNPRIEPLAALPVNFISQSRSESVPDLQKLEDYDRVLVEIYLERLRLLDLKAELDLRKIPLERSLASARQRVNIQKQQIAAIETALSRQMITARSTLLQQLNAAKSAEAFDERSVNSLDLALKPLRQEEISLYEQADQLRLEWLRLVDPFGAVDRAEYDRAVLAFSEWITLDSEFALAYVTRALFYARSLENLNQAMTDIRRAKRLNQDQAVVQAAEAYIRHRMGETTVAKSLFRDARIRNQQRWFVYFLQGLFHRESEEYRRASADFRRAIGDGFEHVHAMIQLAEILAGCPDDEIRNGKEAVSIAERACALSQQKNWQALLALATAHAENGAFEEAVTCCEDAVANAPSTFRLQCQERLKLFLDGKAWRMPTSTTED